jgi:predicted DNA-binding transcriptional regulator AlpA
MTQMQGNALLTREETCRFFGGIDASTLYRGIKADPPRYPKPVKVGPGSSRWLRAECETALASMMEARHG